MKSLVISLFICAVCALARAEEERLHLKILKHQPCTKLGAPNEKIRFPSMEEATLQEDPDNVGCYFITGNVRVLQPINGQVYIFVQFKFGTKAPMEPCQGADKNGCGGVGSCVYCDACKGIKELGKSSVKLVVANKQLNCSKGLEARNYTDIRMSFCMPTEQQLKGHNIDSSALDRLGPTGQTTFITMFAYEIPVNTLPREKLVEMSTPDNKNVCGCHKLVGNIFKPSDSSS